MQKSKSIRLTESAIMLAFGTILSMIAIVQLPFGGSITAFSMLPIILIAYRHGTKWGLFTALAFSLLQMLLGLNHLSYATSVQAVIAIILLDYVAAFTVLGLAGMFRKFIPTQASALVAGTIFVCVLRYISHVLVGYTVWVVIFPPTITPLIYSLAYNATYMLPEMLVTVVGALYISRVLDFRSESITRVLPQAKVPDLAILYSGLSKAFLLIAAVFDIQHVFAVIQKEEGGFDFTQFVVVNWGLLAMLTVGAVVLAILFGLLAKKVPADSSLSLRGLFTTLPFVGVLTVAFFDVLFIIDTLKKPLTANLWVKIAVSIVAVLAAAILVTRRYLTKRNEK